MALELFAERGYDRTRVADIAEVAGVTEMTFYRYFPAKELVVVDDPYDPAIGAAVAAQPHTLPALERVRRGLVAAWQAMPAGEDPDVRLRLRIGAGHPGLRARMRENTGRTEEVVVHALTEHGVRREVAVVAAGAVLGALTSALLEWARTPPGDDAAEHLTERPLGEVVLGAMDQLAAASGAGR